MTRPNQTLAYYLSYEHVLVLLLICELRLTGSQDKENASLRKNTGHKELLTQIIYNWLCIGHRYKLLILSKSFLRF